MGKSRFFSSLSFRINIVLIIIMILLAWGFTAIISTTVTGITNSSRCVTMANIVCGSIDNELLRIESVMKAGALSVRMEKMNSKTARLTCDSICSMAGVDSVYVERHRSYKPEITNAIRKARRSGTSFWSEPHKAASKNGTEKVMVTYVTPLRNRYGATYAVLCADVNLDWLKRLAQNESATDNTTLSVVSRKGKYVYNTDSSLVLTDATAQDKIDKKSKGGKDPYSKFIFEKKTVENSDPLFGGVMFSDSLAKVTRNIDRAGWNVQCIVPMSDNSTLTIFIIGVSITLMAILFIIIILAIVFTVKWQLKPLKKFSGAMEGVSKGDFTRQLPKVKGHTEINDLHDSFERMQKELKTYINDLKVTTETKAGMERDLQIASKIQQGMLPKIFPAFPEREDIDIFGLQKPAKQVGGDIFDFFMRDEQLYFCIGDVSGKGVPAALIMTVVGHLFRNVGRHVSDPSKIVIAINQGLSQGNEENMFCTLFVGVLDMRTYLLRYCNAGHNAPIFCREGDASFMTTDINMPTGVFEEFEYRPQQLQMHHGDSIFLYTDGVTEAENKKKCLFGDNAILSTVERIEQKSKDAPEKSPVTMQVLTESVLAEVQEFAKDTEQSDDITILAMRI